MRVLGLDLSIAATGIAGAAGTLGTVINIGAAGDERLTRIRDTVRGHLDFDDRPHLVVIEDVVVRSGASSVLGMLHGVVRADLLDRNIPYVTVPPATLKVYATGRGNATKPDMRMSLYQRAGIDERDDNRVDAWWLRALGHDLAGHPLLDLPKTHRRALDKLALSAAAVTEGNQP